MFGFEAGLFSQLALSGAKRFFAYRTAAFRYLPRVLLEWVTVLTHKINMVSLDRENAHSNVLKVHHTVNTRLAIRTDDFVLAHGDPGIIVDLLRCEDFPRAFSFIRGHSVSSARKRPLTCTPLIGPVRSWLPAEASALRVFRCSYPGAILTVFGRANSDRTGSVSKARSPPGSDRGQPPPSAAASGRAGGAPRKSARLRPPASF